MRERPLNLFFTAEIFYPDLAGGIMRFFRYGPGLVRRGVLPRVVTLRHREELPREEEVNGIHILRLDPPDHAPGSTLRTWLLKQALGMSLDSIRQGGRAALQPAMFSHLMGPTLWEARVRGIPTFFNVTIAPDAIPRGSAVVRECRRLRMGAASFPVNRIVFLSEQLLRIHRDHWALRSKQVRLIPNGVDLQRFRPRRSAEERESLLRSLGFPTDRKIILFVGGVMERKGVDILLDGWDRVRREHPDAILFILGSRGGRPSHQRPGYGNELKTYVGKVEDRHRRLEHPESVFFHDETDDPAPFYRMADVFAFPSRCEGLPNVVLEAMACGLPCLVARFTGMPGDGEELGHAGRHFVSLGHDPDEWAEGLCAMLRPERAGNRIEMGRSARSWIETRHDLEGVLDRWASLYHEPWSP
jgi:glycosyltransferase involved in cell wall biosynthesis